MRLKALYKDLKNHIKKNFSDYLALYAFISLLLSIGVLFTSAMIHYSISNRPNWPPDLPQETVSENLKIFKILSWIGISLLSSAILITLFLKIKNTWDTHKPTIRAFWVRYLASDKKIPLYINDPDHNTQEAAKQRLRKERKKEKREGRPRK